MVVGDLLKVTRNSRDLFSTLNHHVVCISTTGSLTITANNALVSDRGKQLGCFFVVCDIAKTFNSDRNSYEFSL